MLVGRSIFGLGGESMSVTQSAIVTKWFKGKELAFALAVNISVARLGNVVCGWVVPPANLNHGLGFALLIGVFVCLFSYGCAIALCGIDKYADKVDGKGANMITEEDKFRFKDLLKFKVKFWLIAVSCILIYAAVFPYMQFVTKML